MKSFGMRIARLVSSNSTSLLLRQILITRSLSMTTLKWIAY